MLWIGDMNHALGKKISYAVIIIMIKLRDSTQNCHFVVALRCFPVLAWSISGSGSWIVLKIDS